MYKNLVIVVALSASISSLANFSAASANTNTEHTQNAPKTNNEVCKPLDSGKIDLGGNLQSITREAPEGKIITGYCVKAGSTQQGNGPKYVTGLKSISVTITHPSGKAISHYSLSYGSKVTPSTTNNDAEPTTPAHTTPSDKDVDVKATPVIVTELPKTGSNKALSIALIAGAITAIVTALVPMAKKAYLKRLYS